MPKNLYQFPRAQLAYFDGASYSKLPAIPPAGGAGVTPGGLGQVVFGFDPEFLFAYDFVTSGIQLVSSQLSQPMEFSVPADATYLLDVRLQFYCLSTLNTQLTTAPPNNVNVWIYVDGLQMEMRIVSGGWLWDQPNLSLRYASPLIHLEFKFAVSLLTANNPHTIDIGIEAFANNDDVFDFIQPSEVSCIGYGIGPA